MEAIFLNNRALVLGLDSQDDDVNLACQGRVRRRGGRAQLVGQVAGLGSRAVREDQRRRIDTDATAPRAMAWAMAPVPIN